MIYTEIANISHYHGLGEYLDKAVDYLASHPLDGIQAGHYDIDGDRVYMMCSTMRRFRRRKGSLRHTGNTRISIWR